MTKHTAPLDLGWFQIPRPPREGKLPGSAALAGSVLQVSIRAPRAKADEDVL